MSYEEWREARKDWTPEQRITDLEAKCKIYERASNIHYLSPEERDRAAKVAAGLRTLIQAYRRFIEESK